MKLLLLADAFSVHTEKWLEGLSFSQSWDCHLVTLNPAGVRERIQSHPRVSAIHNLAPQTISATGQNYQYLWRLPQLWKLKTELQPNLISTIYLTSYGLLGALVAGSTPLCHYVIGSDIMVAPQKSLALKWISQFALDRAELVISASQTMKQILINRLGVADQYVLTQQYGVPEALLKQGRETEKIFDFVSNRAWIPNSNVDLFLELLSAVDARIRVALIGQKVAGHEELADRIEQKLPAFGQLRWQRWLPHAENLQQVAQSRFFVSLTQSDGASLSLMEGMALGVVPIVSDIAANREWVEHGVNGFLVPLSNRQAGVQIFSEALKLSPERFAFMQDRNRQIILERGSYEKNMARASRAMAEVAQGRAPI